MEHAGRVRVGDGFGHHPDVPPRPLGRERLRLHQLRERRTGDQFHREEGLAFEFADLVDGDDVGMSQPRRRLGLRPEARQELGSRPPPPGSSFTATRRFNFPWRAS